MTTAVAIVALERDRVLLIRSRKRSGSVEIPCGGLRPDESVFEGAARELWEETGLIAHAWHALPLAHKAVRGHHVAVLWLQRWRGTLRAGDDAEAVFFGDPGWLREGSHPEDYDTVIRAMDRRKVAGQ